MDRIFKLLVVHIWNVKITHRNAFSYLRIWRPKKIYIYIWVNNFCPWNKHFPCHFLSVFIVTRSHSFSLALKLLTQLSSRQDGTRHSDTLEVKILNLKGSCTRKLFFCSFNVHLACEHDAEKINEFISLNCLKKCNFDI